MSTKKYKNPKKPKQPNLYKQLMLLVESDTQIDKSDLENHINILCGYYDSNELKNVCDRLFRIYLINRAKKNRLGHIYCEITKQFLPASQIDVCHFIDRENLKYRYDERTCYLCSSYSNRADSSIDGIYRTKHHTDFFNLLKTKIGSEELCEILKDKELVFASRVFYINHIINFVKYLLYECFNRKTQQVD